MDDPITGQESTEVPSKLVINGQEYDPAEAENLIGLGKRTQEYETQANTKVDRIYPEYTRLTQAQKDWQVKEQEYQTKLAAFETKQQNGTDTAADREKAKSLLKEMGFVASDDLKQNGYMTKEEVDAYLTERDEKKREVEKILSTANTLEKEIDGTDGRPKFRKEVVLAYANQYSIPDLKKAYDKMYEPELNEWKQGQVDAKRSPGLKTLRDQKGTKEPEKTKVTDDNVKDLLTERLYGKQS